MNHQALQYTVQCGLSDFIDSIDIINLFSSYKFMKHNLECVRTITFPANAKIRHNIWFNNNRIVIDNIILKSLCKFPLFEFHAHSHNGIFFDDIELLAKLPLKKLHLKCWRGKHKILHQFKNLKLIDLKFGNCSSDKELVHFDISQLKYLDVISYEGINDKCFQYIANAQQLTYLKADKSIIAMKKCLFTDNGLKYISCLRMSHLSLACRVMCEYNPTDNALAFIAQMPLNHLNILAWNITNNGLKHLAKMPLKYLNISYCEKITDDGLEHLTNLQLEYLYISCCKKITSVGMMYVATQPLKYLDISYCRQICDNGMNHLSDLPLKYLNINSCKKITDIGMSYLAKMPLENLNINNCIKITDNGLFHLANLPLKKLFMSGCNKITKNCVILIKN